MDRSVEGQPASALLGVSLPDPDGKEQALAQWKGKVMVVNFWATWCAPCREEMPMFVRVQRELGPKGVQFVGIAVDSPDKARKFADELKLNYPTLIGGYGAMELSKTLGNSVMALPVHRHRRPPGTGRPHPARPAQGGAAGRDPPSTRLNLTGKSPFVV